MSRISLIMIVPLTCAVVPCCLNETEDAAVAATFDKYEANVRRMVSDVFAKVPPDVLRSLQSAEVSATCSLGLLKMMRGFRNLKPWALRLIDASGKYPTGAFEGTKSDIGAFDECLGTEVVDEYGHVTSQGQYCSLMFYVKNGRAWAKRMEPLLENLHPRLRPFKEYIYLEWLHVGRLGICLLNDCDKRDLQALINTVKPSIINIEVAHCTTSQPEPWTEAQKAITIFLTVLASVVAASTAIDIFTRWRGLKDDCKGVPIKIMTSFAVTSNTRMLLNIPDEKESDQYVFRFIHGIRLFSIFAIIFGHCGETMSDTWSGVVNLLIETHKWTVVILAIPFTCVDTFFFFSGFLMCLATAKRNLNRPTIIFFALVLRHLRTNVPLFFVIMCIYLVPLMLSGPDLQSFMDKFYHEISEHWWNLLVQVRNFYKLNHKTMLPHIWYISVDFQAFVICLLTFQLLKRWKKVAIAAFILMSIVSCGVAAWQIAGTDVPPFVIFPVESPEVLYKMANEYYLLPFYHLVCYFCGCITFLILDDFKRLKLSKALEAAGWSFALGCCLCCLFIRLPWYRHSRPTTEVGTLLTAFFDRILWSVFLSWITLAFATQRGGFVRDFFAWKPFVPLSRLSFGVYLIHLPFIEVFLHRSSERLQYSMFNQCTLFFAVSVWSFLLGYLLFLVCEAPTGKLSKLVFEAGGPKSKSPGRNVGAAEDDLRTHSKEDFKCEKAHTQSNATYM